MAEQVIHVHKELPNPRFDYKVAMTTRGWSWEYEIKDAVDGETADKLAEQAYESIMRAINLHEERSTT